MSFFLPATGKSRGGKGGGGRAGGREAAAGKKRRRDDEELDSDREDDRVRTRGGGAADDDDAEWEETVDEKRVRKAREYLELLEQQQLLEAEDDDDDDDEDRDDDDDDGDGDGAMGMRMAKELKRQAAIKSGRFVRHLAPQLEGIDGLEPMQVLRGHHQSATAVALVDDGSRAFTAAKDGTLVQWDVETGAKTKLASGRKANAGHKDQINAVAVTSDGKVLATGGKDKSIRIWDARTGAYIDRLTGHRDAVTALAFRRGHHQLFSGSADRTIKSWNVDEMAYTETLFGHHAEVLSMASLNKERAVSCSRDKSVRLWNILEDSQLVYTGEASSMDCVALANEDNFLTGGDDGSLSFYSVYKKKAQCVVQATHGRGENGRPNWVTALAACPFSDLAATGSHDGHVRLWATDSARRTVKSLSLTSAVRGVVNGLAFSGDGRILVAAVGADPRLGRWFSVPSVRNGIGILRLPVEDEWA